MEAGGIGVHHFFFRRNSHNFRGLRLLFRMKKPLRNCLSEPRTPVIGTTGKPLQIVEAVCIQRLF